MARIHRNARSPRMRGTGAIGDARSIVFLPNVEIV